MEKKVFDLDGVSRDEANEVRKVLRKSRIQFFEIPEGRFLGGGGIWVRSEEDFQKGRRAIDAYQNQLMSQQPSATQPWHVSVIRRLFANPRFAVLLLIVLLTVVMIILPVPPLR